MLSSVNVKRCANPLLRIASAIMNPPIIRKMIGFAKPTTALVKSVTPIIGCTNNKSKDVTARCTASVTHIIMAKIKSASAACPEKLKPGVGMSIMAMNSSIARGNPKTFKFIFVFNPPKNL